MAQPIDNAGPPAAAGDDGSCSFSCCSSRLLWTCKVCRDAVFEVSLQQLSSYGLIARHLHNSSSSDEDKAALRVAHGPTVETASK